MIPHLRRSSLYQSSLRQLLYHLRGPNCPLPSCVKCTSAAHHLRHHQRSGQETVWWPATFAWTAETSCQYRRRFDCNACYCVPCALSVILRPWLIWDSALSDSSLITYDTFTPHIDAILLCKCSRQIKSANSIVSYVVATVVDVLVTDWDRVSLLHYVGAKSWV